MKLYFAMCRQYLLEQSSNKYWHKDQERKRCKASFSFLTFHLIKEIFDFFCLL